MIRKTLDKNLNFFRHYGVLGALRIYARAAVWSLLHIVTKESLKYKNVKVNDYQMYIDIKDTGISKALFIYGTRENDQMYMAKSVLRSGMEVLDIGANIGYYVIFESQVIGSAGKIIAYEPSVDNCALLRKNIELNKLSARVEINNAAVSNRAGKSRFYLSDKSNLHTLNPVHYGGGSKVFNEEKFVDVETADIYQILKAHKSIKFVRMDIEGHEVEVLGGIAKAAKELGVYPSILFETHMKKYDSAQHDITSKLKDLFELGYFPKMVASSDKKSSELRLKYDATVVVNTDRFDRGIYEGVTNEDMIKFITIPGVRAILLEKAMKRG